MIFDIDVPRDLSVDVTGLPPARARLARLTAWHKVNEGAALKLAENRERLVVELAVVGAAQDRLAEAVAADTRGLLSSMRDGAAWALAAISGGERASLDTQLSAARHRHEVGSAALLALDKDIAATRAIIADLEMRIADAVMAALREHAAATTGREYVGTLALLREQMCELEGVARLVHEGHDGRFAAAVPGFKAAGHTTPFEPVVCNSADLKASIGVWWQLAEAWRADAHADPADFLIFPPLTDDPADGVPYHALNDLERNKVDRAFVR